MTDARETSRSIDAKAAEWIARLDRGPLTGEEARALEAWLDGDPRRRGALLRAGSLWTLSESAQTFGAHSQPMQCGADTVSIHEERTHDNQADQGARTRPTH